MAQSPARLRDDEVEPQRQPRHRRPIAERAPFHECERRGAEPSQLRPVDRLLGEAEVAPRAPADLDDHEGRARRVHGDEVELGSADADVPAEDVPARALEVVRDDRLGRVTRSLGRRAHPGRMAAAAYVRLHVGLSADDLPADHLPATRR